jgi:hypothetical protein
MVWNQETYPILSILQTRIEHGCLYIGQRGHIMLPLSWAAKRCQVRRDNLNVKVDHNAQTRQRRQEPIVQQPRVPQQRNATVTVAEYFKSPDILWSPLELREFPENVPKLKGVYGWYFGTIPRGIPRKPFIESKGWKLLYIGIAGQSPTSLHVLRSRAGQHLKGNAEGSTLRMSLGCLLQEELGIRLQTQRTGGNTFWFGEKGEKKLSQWLKAWARIAWCVEATPWESEKDIFATYGELLPLNIKDNPKNEFRKELKRIRSDCRKKA